MNRRLIKPVGGRHVMYIRVFYILKYCNSNSTEFKCFNPKILRSISRNVVCGWRKN